MVFCRKVCQSILIIALFCSGQLAAQTFTYSYSNLFDGELDRASGFTEFEMLRAVEESLALWASVTPLNFVEQPDSGPPASDNPYPAASHPDIRIGHHELSGSTLAHAYFPGGGGLDSDLHMDSSNRTWRESTFFTTMAHELGHTIGIGHIDDAVAIMNSSIGSDNSLPGLGRGFLFEADIRAAERRWGSGTGEVVTFRDWSGGSSNEWSNHDNWQQGWRPTQFSRVTLGGDVNVSVGGQDRLAANIELGIGRNQLTVRSGASLTVENDVTLGSQIGGQAIVSEATPSRAFVPTNSAIHDSWFLADFNDSNWISGTPGFGYERRSGFENLIETNVETQMYNRNGSFYSRMEFDISNPEELDVLSLRMKYDDGFVAYLNGSEIARANVPNQIRWNSTANSSRGDENAIEFNDFDLTDRIDLLQPGKNVLAIQGLNHSRTSSDLLILPKLVGGKIQNNLTVQGGEMLVGGNVTLSEHARSNSELTISNGDTVVRGNIAKGNGVSKLVISGGSLTVEGGHDQTRVVDANDTVRFSVPTRTTSEQWFATDFDDSDWRLGRAALGYERGAGFESSIETDVEADMFNRNASLYSRIDFSIDDLTDVDKLTLRMKFDDGFVAYLNGEQVASANAPDSPDWNSTSTTNVSDGDAQRFADFDISTFKDLLNQGANILAIRGLNRSTTSSDMLIVPELVTQRISGQLSADVVEFSGGQILGVSQIDAEFQHKSGTFSPTGATIEVGIQSLEINGSYEMNSDAVLRIDLDQELDQRQFDKVSINGSARLFGTLDIAPTGDYVDPMEPGEVVEIDFLNATIIEGDFESIVFDETPIQLGHQSDGLFRWLGKKDESVAFVSYQAIPGDVTGDQIFDSNDLVVAFQAGEYEDSIVGNSIWTDGDWNGDGDFTSSDFITAFATGLYSRDARIAINTVPEPVAHPWVGLLLIAWIRSLRPRYRA